MQDSLQYVVVPGLDPSPRLVYHYEAAFDLWKSVWRQTFAELDGLDTIFSDDFTRQEEVGCFFLRERCIALIFMRELDFSLPGARHDSYFECWTDVDIRKLLKDGNRVQVGSYITVHPLFRRKLFFGLKLKNLLLQMSIKRLLESSCDVMTGITRCDRGVNTLAIDLGATLLSKDVRLHSVSTDLVAWYRRGVSRLPRPNGVLIDRLWRERICSDSVDDSSNNPIAA